MAIKCKKCIHSYHGHIKREGMGGYTEYIPGLKCDVGYEIQTGGVPKNPDCFEPKGRWWNIVLRAQLVSVYKIKRGVNETDNPDAICDDCKFSIISDDDIPLNIYI